MLKGRKQKANRVDNSKNPKADPNGAHVPRNGVAHVVVMLMLDFSRCILWRLHKVQGWGSEVQDRSSRSSWCSMSYFGLSMSRNIPWPAAQSSKQKKPRLAS